MTSPIMSPLACPTCGQLDQVQHVPAVVDSGMHTYAGSGPMLGYGDGGPIVGYGTHSGTTMTWLAEQLQPPQPARPSGGCLLTLFGTLFTLGAILFTVVAATVTRTVVTAPPTSTGPATALIATWIFPTLAATAAVLCFNGIRLSHRNTARLNIGLDGALWIWSCGWLCHRCGGVYFPLTGPDLPAGKLLNFAQSRPSSGPPRGASYRP